jgi:hypothetical protein
MKTSLKISAIIIAFAVVSMPVIGQIKVNSSGNVGIGTSNPTHKLTLVGATKFNNNVGIDWDPIDLLTVNIGGSDRKINIHSWSPVYWDCTGSCSAPCLYPSQTWYQQLGKPSYRIGQIWSHDIHCTVAYEDSDIRLKTNVATLGNTLSKLLQLSAIQYTLTDEAVKTIPNELKSSYQRKQFGFLAQEVQEVFPELVHTDSGGYLGIAYTRFIPLLVQTIKEQQQVIDAQSAKIKELDERLTKLENKGLNDKPYKSISTEQDDSFMNDAGVGNSPLYLYQNVPNPFNESTAIRCYVSETIQKAELCIYNMQGTQLKCITVSERGTTTIEIQAGQLAAGVYTYLLIGDSKASEAKQMILTK